MQNNHHYNKNLKDHARKLRTESISKAEKYLWKSLLKEGNTGVKFKRQRPIDRYIVDFMSPEINLIIEIDGSSHFNKSESDRSRQDRLEALGFHLLRFEESEVLTQLNNVYDKITYAIHALQTESIVEESSPSIPLRRGKSKNEPKGGGKESVEEESSPSIPLQRGKLVEEPQPTYRRGSGLITV